MTDPNPANTNAVQNTDGETVESLQAKINGLEDALGNQNEANKRQADGKLTLENDLTASQARVKELEAAVDPKDALQQVAELKVDLARSNAVSLHNIPHKVAAKLNGTPDEIMDLASTLASAYKKDDNDDTGPDGKPKDPANPSDKTDANLSDKDKNKIADVKPPVYGAAASTDVDSIMRELAQSMKSGS